MPCDTIQTSKVEFLATSTDLDLLTKSLEALGYEVRRSGNMIRFSKYGRQGSFNKTTGELTLDSNWDGNEIKRGYSEQIVQSQADKHGWKISWSTNDDGEREATVMKRG